jgi:KRAB domain-containing zinc finger protein
MSQRDMKLHRLKVHQNFYCKICDKIFLDKIKFNNHMKAHENFDYDNGELKCKICRFKSESLNGFQLHFKLVHEILPKSFECEICKKKFSSASNLKVHKKNHMSKIKFQCDLCPKTFKSKIGLLAHLTQKHASNTKVLRCKTCSYETKLRDGLKRHEKIHNKTLKCPKCDKKFATKWFLNEHFNTHGDAKDYKCDQCSYAGKSRRNLNCHKKRHL